jgi:hypothetical protein
MSYRVEVTEGLFRLKKAKQKLRKEPKHEAGFKLNVDYMGTLERLKSAGFNPIQDGGRPSLKGDSPGGQIRVMMDKLATVALISNTKIQIFYRHEKDLPTLIWRLQPLIIEAETQKPVQNLATKLEYTTLTKAQINDLRKATMVNDLKMMIQLEKNRMLTEIFQSLVSELKSIDDAEIQARIKPVLKIATDLFSKLDA